MRLTVVGPAAAWSREPGRSSSCYLIEEGETAVALDLGQGSFAALSGFRDPASLSAVFVSHLHADHGVDLVPLRHYLRFGAGNGATVALHAPPGLRARYDAFLAEKGFLSRLPGRDLAPGASIVVGALNVRAQRVTHHGQSYGFRVAPAGAEDGPGLAYTGDCGREDDAAALARPGDTLVCEAYFGVDASDPAAGHLDATQAGNAARRADAARLVLTHLRDGSDVDAVRARAEEHFAGPVIVAEPGLQLDIP